jgi:hypothetical protein
VGLFVLGGILFWLVLSQRVVRPLEQLATFSQEIGQKTDATAAHQPLLQSLTERADGSVSPQPVGTDGMTTSALGAGQGGNAAIEDGTQSSAATNAQPPAAPAAEQQSAAPAGEAAPAQQPAQPAQTQIAPAVLPPGTVQDNPTSTN